MVVSEDFFSRDWANAAERAARLTRLVPVRRLSVPPVADRTPWLGRRPGEQAQYEVAMRNWRPDRVLGRVARRLNDARLVGAVRHIGEEEGAVELVHAHFYSNARPLPLVRRVLGVPYVLTEHSSALMDRPGVPVRAATLRRAERACRSAAAVMVVSDALGRSMTAHGLPGPFHLVPDPIDIHRFALPRPPRPDGPVRLLAVGTLIPRKGFDLLLEAAAELQTRGRRFVLDVVGGGRPDELRRLRDGLGLADAVRFLGRLDRPGVDAVLAACDVFVSSSHAETFGVAIAEALCAGVPVVATAVGGVPEVVQDGWGVLVPPGDAGSLADALASILDRLGIYDSEAIGRAARQRFSYDAVGARLAEVYRSALLSHRGSA